MVTPEEIVEGQLEAFNAHDLDALCRWFADDVSIVDLVDGSTVLAGIADFRARYVAVFRDRPQVHATVIGRLVLGRWVVDREQLTDGPGTTPEDALAIYEIDGERVVRMWFVEPDHRRAPGPHRPGIAGGA